MRLLMAWVVSALAGAVAYPIGGLLAVVLLGGRPFWSAGLVRFALYVFAFRLVFQLVYGGVLYLVLGSLGLLNLPVILLAYLVPLMLLVFAGSDTPKDLIMGTRYLVCGRASQLSLGCLSGPNSVKVGQRPE